MTQMDRIEGPSKQPNSLPFGLLFNLSTLLHNKSKIRISKFKVNFSPFGVFEF